MLTAVDIFCGAGGMSAGLEKAGFNIIGAVDYWKPAIRTYCRNFSYPVVLADIRAVSDTELKSFLGIGSKRVDLLVGGPPCQGFTPRNAHASPDVRAELIFEFVRLVGSLRPRMFLMECKSALINKNNEELKDSLEAALTDLGYGVGSQVVNAADYGVPQIRKKLFFYGWLRAELPEFPFPAPEYGPGMFRTVEEAINDLPSPAPDGSSLYGDPHHYRIRTLEINLERLRYIPPGGGVKDLPDNLKPTHYLGEGYRSGYYRGSHHGAYGRLHPNKPAAAILEGFDSFTRGKYGHPYEDRNITLREGARLQTFPDSFIFEGSQREITSLIGNATPPLLAEKLAAAISRHLRRNFEALKSSHPFATPSRAKGSKSPKKAIQSRFEFTPEVKRSARRQTEAARSALRSARFYSCFISFSSKDMEFTKKIYEDLKARGVRCWFAPEDMKIGDKFRVRIDDEIRSYDRLLLVLSKNSVSSTWVAKEVETAFEREAEQDRIMLFPVRLDDAVWGMKTGWAADIKRSCHIGDFSRWKHEDNYRHALEKLLRDLEVDQSPSILADSSTQQASSRV